MGKNSQLRLTQYDLNAFNKSIKCPFNRIDKTFISNNRWGTMEKYTGNGNKLYTCFVDFAKAFDTVMYSGLFYKLVELGISGPFYNVLKNMYDTNYVSVLTGPTSHR